VQVGKALLHDGWKNVVIIQGFKEYCALGFFQGALLRDPKNDLATHRAGGFEA
jgi:uncharacterized protein YdeI (YjbR/CyaY-like superfamily)